MPRRARILLPGVSLHLIQRGNNRSACFYADEDYLFYLDVLMEQAKKDFSPIALQEVRLSGLISTDRDVNFRRTIGGRPRLLV